DARREHPAEPARPALPQRVQADQSCAAHRRKQCRPEPRVPGLHRSHRGRASVLKSRTDRRGPFALSGWLPEVRWFYEGGTGMSRRRRHRTLIWTAVGVQVAGLIVDIIWHAVHSDFEAKTVEQMVVHLGTIHIPIYVGVLCVLLTTAWALIDQARRPPIGAAFPVAFLGGLVSTA